MTRRDIEWIKFILLLGVSFIIVSPITSNSTRLSYYFRHLGLYSDKQSRIEEIERAKETGKHINIPSYKFLLEMIGNKNKKSESATLNRLSNKKIDSTKLPEEENEMPNDDEDPSCKESFNLEKAPPTQIEDSAAMIPPAAPSNLK